MTARNVLIVEDEMIVQMHLERIVSQCGHKVTGTATTLRGALESAEREEPELVLMDINLANGDDGIEAAELLSERYGCATVFVTAFADIATLARSENVGAAGFVVKPFIDADVRAAMSTAFASHAVLNRIREREHSMSSALRGMKDAILVMNEDGSISLLNEQAAALTGWDTREAESRHLLEVLNCSAESDQRSIREALEHFEPTSLSRLEIEDRDGNEHIVDFKLEPLTLEPLTEGDPEARELVVTLRDRAPEHDVRIPGPVELQPFGVGTRLLVYSHDTFGMGHLQRSLNLIRNLVADHPGVSVLLVTGSSVVHRYSLPEGADYMKLPSVRKVGKEQYEPRSLELSSSGIQRLRENLLLRTARDYDPNVLLVDHSPVGMKGELRPTLEWLKQRQRCTRILGLRDIIDEPSSVTELWNDKDIYGVLREHYDHVVVYGSREVYDPVRRYSFPADLEEKTRFLGYVCEPGEHEDGAELQPRSRPQVLLSVGGGDGGELLIGAYLDMLQRLRSRVGFDTRILTGPLLEEKFQERFRERAQNLPVTIDEFVPSTSALMRSADLVVSTAGYNTTTQLLAHAKRAILVPRVLHRQEQLIRARRFDELGLMPCLLPGSLTPEGLFAAIEAAFAESGPLLREHAPEILPLDGARQLSEFCGSLQVWTERDDRPDFEKLVERHYVSLYRFAFSLTRNEAQASDLAQQTFYLWAEKGHQLRDVSKAKTWLFTTLHREFLQTQRRQNRFPHDELEQAELPSIQPSLIARLDGKSALEALSRLDGPYQAPLALFYLQGLSYKEVAETLEIPIGTAQSRIARGKAQLLRTLTGADGAS